MNCFYPRTDLACEKTVSPEGLRRHTFPHGIFADESGSGTPGSRYFTVHCGQIWTLSSARIRAAVRAVASLLHVLLHDTLRHYPDERDSILVVGIGNRLITADALGPLTAERVLVTRHAPAQSLPALLHCCRVSAISPGVSSQTGIDSALFLQKAAEAAQASVILAVDALAARSPERIGTTIQLSDSGIHPGSGIGSHTTPLRRESMGIPVIGIGIPTLIDTATLVWDVLEKAGMQTTADAFHETLERGQNFFVSPRETDLITDTGANLLSHAINLTLSHPLQT